MSKSDSYIDGRPVLTIGNKALVKDIIDFLRAENIEYSNEAEQMPGKYHLITLNDERSYSIVMMQFVERIAYHKSPKIQAANFKAKRKR